MRKILCSSPAWLFLLCFLAPELAPAHACSCLGPHYACEAFWTTPAVFIGRVLDFRVIWSVRGTGEWSHVGERRSALFEVEEVFKGVSESEGVVEVYTGMGGGDCGYDFETGERYLVFAHRDPDDGRLRTGICTLTHPVSADEGELFYLRSLPTAPREGWVFGFVESYWYRMGDHSSRKRKMCGIEIVLEGKSGQYQAESDENGDYRIDHLPPGTYKYRVDLTGDEESPRTGEFDLYEKGCVELFFIYKVDPPGEHAPQEGGDGEDPEN